MRQNGKRARETKQFLSVSGRAGAADHHFSKLVPEYFQGPKNGESDSCNQSEQDRQECEHKNPVAGACATSRGFNVPLEELDIFDVAPKPDRKNITEEGNRADRCVDGNIEAHPDQYYFRV